MWYPLYFLIHLKLSQGFHDLLHQVKYLKLQADEQMRSEIFQAFLAVKVLSRSLQRIDRTSMIDLGGS
ncbi:hypothetical protein AT4G24615, partial [Arabidopsis thaliana]